VKHSQVMALSLPVIPPYPNPPSQGALELTARGVAMEAGGARRAAVGGSSLAVFAAVDIIKALCPAIGSIEALDVSGRALTYL
jgi:hypothetical protein